MHPGVWAALLARKLPASLLFAASAGTRRSEPLAGIFLGQGGAGLASDFQFPIRLGNYVLTAHAGEGGMSQVFVADGFGGERFAVKLVTHSSAAQAHFRLSILREIRALAQLYHPNVVRVLDAGYVRGAEAEASKGALPVGAPYMVSEFLEGHELGDVLGRMEWSALRSLLLALLDALGHAHGLGIVHRDIKPSNVMICREGGVATPKLADFGISRSVYKDVGNSLKVSGTPLYMSPEQATGQWRDEGPWTDIYAIGVMTWRGVCGTEPFHGTTSELLSAHALGALPDFRPQIVVPGRIEDWLHKALAKSPSDRFQTAAEAALALVDLDIVHHGRTHPTQHVPAVAETDAPSDLAETIFDAPVPAITFAGLKRARSTGRGSEWPQPTLPADWRRSKWKDFDPVRLGTGLGIVSSRSVPVVDRDAVRDRLWKTLRRVHRSGVSEGVLIEGEAGLGKSKLVQWLQRRGREIGVCEPFTVRGLRWKSATESVREALDRHFLTMGYDRARVFGRVVQAFERCGLAGHVPTYDAAAIAEFLVPDTDDLEHQSSRSSERWLPIVRYLSALASRNTLVLAVEDIHQGPDLLDLVGALVDRAEGPILSLVTTRPTEDFAELGSQRVEQFGFERIILKPLDFPDQLQLVERMIGLEPVLADRVARESRGVPEDAFEMIRVWVEQDMLEPGAEGLQLRGEANLELPSRRDQRFWTARLEAAARDLPLTAEAMRKMLEFAAVLGPVVTTKELCLASGESERVVAIVVDELSRRGVLVAAEAGWTLERQELRDFLIQSARSENRFTTVHRQCLEFVEQHVLEADGRSLRRAVHLEALGQPADSFEAYEEALDAGIAMVDPQLVRRCVAKMEQLLGDLPQTEDYHCRTELSRARQLRIDESFTDAVKRAAGVVEEADRRGWDLLATRAEVIRAEALREGGKTEGAAEGFERALARAQRTGATRSMARSHRGLASVYARAGRTQDVRRHALRALELFRALQEPKGECEALFWYSVGWQLEARLDEAEDELMQATDIAREHGYRLQLAWCLNSQAELARLRDRPAKAKGLLEEAAALHRSLGRDRDALVPELNVALLEIGAENFERAHDLLSELEREAEESGDIVLSLYLPMRLVTTARISPRAGLEELIVRTTAVTARTGTYLPEFARQIERAGRFLRELPEPTLARAAFELAATYYYAVGDAERLDEVNRILQATGPA